MQRELSSLSSHFMELLETKLRKHFSAAHRKLRRSCHLESRFASMSRSEGTRTLLQPHVCATAFQGPRKLLECGTYDGWLKHNTVFKPDSCEAIGFKGSFNH